MEPGALSACHVFHQFPSTPAWSKLWPPSFGRRGFRWLQRVCCQRRVWLSLAVLLLLDNSQAWRDRSTGVMERHDSRSAADSTVHGSAVCGASSVQRSCCPAWPNRYVLTHSGRQIANDKYRMSDYQITCQRLQGAIWQALSMCSLKSDLRCESKDHRLSAHRTAAVDVILLPKLSDLACLMVYVVRCITIYHAHQLLVPCRAWRQILVPVWNREEWMPWKSCLHRAPVISLRIDSNNLHKFKLYQSCPEVSW